MGWLNKGWCDRRGSQNHPPGFCKELWHHCGEIPHSLSRNSLTHLYTHAGWGIRDVCAAAGLQFCGRINPMTRVWQQRDTGFQEGQNGQM